MENKKVTYTTGQLARMLKLTLRTVQYYREIGIITPAVVKPKGKALYGRDAIYTLKKVLYLKNSGCTLKESGQILKALYHNKTHNKELTLFLRDTITQSHKKILDKEKELKKMRIDMEKLLKDSEGCLTCKPPNPEMDCKGCSKLAELKSFGIRD